MHRITGNIFFIENKIEYLSKTIQLYEMILVRHGVMVVGQTCSGKTATIHNLAKAMTKANAEGSDAFAKVQIVTINPKAVTSGQLYGLFDENTHEFVEGILAVTFRRCAKDTSVDRKWMMFDGPVDAVWIEVRKRSSLFFSSILLLFFFNFIFLHTHPHSPFSRSDEIIWISDSMMKLFTLSNTFQHYLPPHRT